MLFQGFVFKRRETQDPGCWNVMCERASQENILPVACIFSRRREALVVGIDYWHLAGIRMPESWRSRVLIGFWKDPPPPAKSGQYITHSFRVVSLLGVVRST